MAAEMAGSGWWQIAESSGGGRQLLRRAVGSNDKRGKATDSGDAGCEDAVSSGGSGRRVMTGRGKATAAGRQTATGVTSNGGGGSGRRVMAGGGWWQAAGDSNEQRRRIAEAMGDASESGLSPKEKPAAPPQPVPFDQETHRLFPDRFRGTAATTAPQSLRSNPASPQKRSPPPRRTPRPPTRKHAAVPAPMREAIIFLAVR